jgi:hypothetical protein
MAIEAKKTDDWQQADGVGESSGLTARMLTSQLMYGQLCGLIWPTKR